MDHRGDAPVQKLRLGDQLPRLHRAEDGGVDGVGDHARGELDRGIQVGSLADQVKGGFARVVPLDPAGVHAEPFDHLARHGAEHLLGIVAAPRRDRDRGERRQLLRAPERFRLDPALLPHLHDGRDVAHVRAGGVGNLRERHGHRAGIAEGRAEVHLPDPARVAVDLLEDPRLEVPRLLGPEEPPEVGPGKNHRRDSRELGQRFVRGDDPPVVPEQEDADGRAVEVLAQRLAESRDVRGRRERRNALTKRCHRGETLHGLKPSSLHDLSSCRSGI